MRPIDIQPSGAIRTTDKVAATARARPAATVASGEKDVEVVRRASLSASEPPIDGERVEQIRQAIAEGTYPLIPAEIADAIIAAKLTLRSPK